MNPKNFEIFNILIILSLTIDYFIKYKKKFTKNSYILFKQVICILILSGINMTIYYVNNTDIEHMLLWIGYSLAIIPILDICYYIDLNYLDYERRKSSKFFLNIFLLLYFCIVTHVFYTNPLNVETVDYITQPTQYYILFLFLALPSIYTLIMSAIKSRIFDKSIYVILMLPLAGIVAEIVFSNEMYVSASLTISTLLLVLNRFSDTMNKDSLTGIYNRRFLDNYVFDNNGLYGLFIIDMDKFKDINDTYGHDMGDRVLKDVSQILLDASRATDSVIRLGGDEFMILARIKGKEGIEKLKNRINTELKKYNETSKIKISFSLGCDVYSANESFIDAFTKIDKKMYEEKEKGRK